MPCDYGFRFHYHQSGRPPWPDLPKDGPEEPVDSAQSWASSLSLEDGNLLAERKNLERRFGASAKEHAYGGDECQQQIDHATVVPPQGQTTSRKRKLLILFAEQSFGYTQP
jgi:hypothetical protein